jgi:hypothetical protein
MADPAFAEAPECAPYDPAIVGPPAPCEPAAEESGAAAPESYVYMGTGEPDPSLAYGHFAEEGDADESADADVATDVDPADYGVGPDNTGASPDPLSEENRAVVLAKPVDDMDDTEFQQMLATQEIDPTQMQSMLDKTSASPERKLELWKKLHVERNAAEMEEACPESESTEDDPERMNERYAREQTQESTKDELDIETSSLPANYTTKDVDALIARKEKEHALEQQYGINITAQKELKEDGTREVWSEKELDQVKTALEQVPPEMFEEGRVKFTELSRVETLYERNGDGTIALDDDGNPKKRFGECEADGTIRISDAGAADGDMEAREMKTPEFENEHGFESSHLERVVTHELGHAVNNGDPETQEVHEDQWKTLPPLKKGTRLGSGEYFAEDFHHALNAPEQFYEDAVEKPQKDLAAAQKEYAADPSEANKDALDLARAQSTAYPQMYANMRNTVFHTNEREDAIAEQLADEGYTKEEIDGFRASAQTVSTPAQLDELSRRQGYLPTED